MKCLGEQGTETSLIAVTGQMMGGSATFALCFLATTADVVFMFVNCKDGNLLLTKI